MILNKNSMVIWGAAGLSHDASISVIKDGKIAFASSSERYSRIKNDAQFHPDLVSDCLKYGNPDVIVWYEKPFSKFLRKLLIDHRYTAYKTSTVKNLFEKFGIDTKIKYVDHHVSHLCASLYTAPWYNIDNTLGVVIDSVGEFKTLSVWDIKNESRYECIYSNNYPNSLGLFYSSITDMLGLKAQEEEYIMMGMAAYGKDGYQKYYDFFNENFFDEENNLVVDLRRGCKDIFAKDEIENNKFDIARAAQEMYEDIVIDLIKKYLKQTGYRKLVMSGGCALNCSANSKILSLVDAMWIFPNPGDSGSSVGAALSYYGKRIQLENMYLGKDAGSNIDIDDLVNHLDKHKVVGVINGKAEFGPRAFGNRSILADPRVHNIKDIVNEVKGREKFRPFAPMVLEGHFNYNFHNLGKYTYYPYMQYTFKCKHPDKYPGIVHVDGTSRVQTVNSQQPFAYELLCKWYELTGCPILLNTSLNIKGKPLLNDNKDIREFGEREMKIYG